MRITARIPTGRYFQRGTPLEYESKITGNDIRNSHSVDRASLGLSGDSRECEFGAARGREAVADGKEITCILLFSCVIAEAQPASRRSL
jgi:hypothetical protein